MTRNISLEGMPDDQLFNSLDLKYNTEIITNPKFYFIICQQSTLYLRIVELFKDPTSLAISAIPLNIHLKTLESDIAISGSLKST